MPIIRDDAVVLARLDYSETSQIVVLFTRQHGKVRAIAKGIKRGAKGRFAVGIDILDVGQVVVSSRHERSPGLATLTEWKQTRSLSGLRERLFRIHAAEYAAEITGQLTEDWDPHAELFDAIVSTLIALSNAHEPLGPTVAYQLRLLESVGSLPRLDTCVLCNRSDALTHFSSIEGGTICRHCEPGQVEKWQISPGVLRHLTHLWRAMHSDADTAGTRGAEADLPAGSIAGAFGVLNYHLAHLTGREPSLASKLITPARRRVVQ